MNYLFRHIILSCCGFIICFFGCKSPDSSAEINTEPSVIADSTLRQVSLADAISQIDTGNGVFAKVLHNKEMFVGLYTPQGEDNQRPHAKDEVYVIVSGSGEFKYGDSISTFQEDDVLFVPAGKEHQFLNFTEDFKAWVVFY